MKFGYRIYLLFCAAIVVMSSTRPSRAQTSHKNASGAITQTHRTATPSPSLDETLKWLTQFLPTATGGQFVPNGKGWETKESTTVQSQDGCSIVLAIRGEHSFGGEIKDKFTATESFSLSDVDPENVQAKTADGIVVELNTKNRVKLIHYQDSDFDKRFSSINVSFFNDQASAERVANAFRRAAGLCAKADPF